MTKPGQPSETTWSTLLGIRLGIGAIIAAVLVVCCALVGGTILIDQFNLWCDAPVINQLVGCP